MHFYSIFVATVALMVSTASASEEHWQKATYDCLNVCHESSNTFRAAGPAATILKPGKDEK
ncbi:hypothetical protein N7516_011103 [Penicillium verrucosum]|uniref:uncharacterized protein n=1 Tax=Penicillium verrucosum TaxID=60171 RepID=UPI002544F3F8|nr:uncharacterized protein N7516_011103 [Penicillium verrucosum]KAJ5920245.1 hypothetical protein N7516_011103 [Penicillium verrucosum]